MRPPDGGHVLHVLAELLPSGAETMLATGAPHLIVGGWRHTVLATATEPGRYAPALAAAGYAIEHLPFRPSPSYVLGLYRLLRRLRPDIVHIHRESASFYHALIALLAGCRVVRTFHNEFRFTGLLRLRRGFQRRLLTLLGVHNNASSTIVARSERQTYGLATSLIECWYDERRFTLPSVADRKAARAKLGLRPGEIAVATVGNCGAFKRHDRLIDALTSLAGVPIHYFHCGIEDAAQTERTAVEHHKLTRRVHFLGAVDGVEDVLTACDAYVMTSSREGFSIATVEAAAMGLPCILTPAGIAPDLAAFPGVTLVTDDDALRQALAALATRRQPPSADLAAAVAARFGSTRQAPKYRALYAALLSNTAR